MSEITPGLLLKSPEGRVFEVGTLTGCDSQGRPARQLKRRDRKHREGLWLWKGVAELETWEVLA